MLYFELLLRGLASPNEHKWVNLCLWEFPVVRRPLCWWTWYVGMESLKAIGLGLAVPPRERLASQPALTWVKVPVCVPCSSAWTVPHPWPRYRIWRVLVFCTNLCQKSFSNFSFSILRVYIFLILCDVMNNKGDRNTFPCCLENFYFWTRSWPTYIHSVAGRSNIGFHKLSVSLRHQSSSKCSSWSQPALN